MGKNVLLPIAYGSEELEAVTIVDLLRRAGINVVVAGEAEMVNCSRGVRIVPDLLLSQVGDGEEFDAIVLPGGGQGVDNLSENEYLLDLIKYNLGKGHLIGTICAAPLILTRHKLLADDVTITSFPDVFDELNHSNYSEDSVVVSGNIITSRGAGTATEFALQLIEILTDKATADKVADDICYQR
jgi:4-methyl-5(b-hydroxyethyl)-thiazole monophosphate biosynthesis